VKTKSIELNLHLMGRRLSWNLKQLKMLGI